jgi:hypothetical protein
MAEASELAGDSAPAQGAVAASNFRLASVQAVIFTPDTEVFAPQRVLTSILTYPDGPYDGPVTSLPLPPDFEPTAPRIVLQSADQRWRVQAGPARIDSFWSGQATLTVASEFARLAEKCSAVLDHYVHETDVRVSRLALVVVRACPVPHPAQILINRFCSEEARSTQFRNSQSFEIHNHKRYVLAGADRTINSWVRCRTASFKEQPVIAVEQDINTLGDEDGPESHRFNVEQIHSFFTHAREESDAILRLYFDEESK